MCKSLPAFVFVSVFLLLVSTRAWAENACVNCHQRLAPTVGRAHNFGEWEKSVHAQKGVTCEKCHGGDPAEEDPIKAHQAILKTHQAKSPLYYSQIPETCGACHISELQEFRKSAHYQELKKSERGPNCVTCHASMAISIPQPGSLEQTCSVCHRERQIAKEALVTLNLAGSALKRWGETFAAVKKRGETTPEQEAALKGNQKFFTEVQKKWHAFSMKDVVEESKKIISAARDAVQNLQPAKGEQ